MKNVIPKSVDGIAGIIIKMSTSKMGTVIFFRSIKRRFRLHESNQTLFIATVEAAFLIPE